MGVWKRACLSLTAGTANRPPEETRKTNGTDTYP